MVTLLTGDCRDVMEFCLGDNSVDAIVTDPPYELGFMGKGWDSTGIANDPAMWREALRVLKPGGHLLAFSGTRTYHRMVCAIEDAGFEIRDQIGWVYGSGFPKSLDVSKAIDKTLGHERERVAPRSVISHQRNIGNRRPYMDDPNHTTVSDEPASEAAAAAWQGWGTALKPAWEPIVVARKPLIGTVAANVLAHGCGALNIDGCRVGAEGSTSKAGMGPGAPTINAFGDGLNTARFGVPVDGLGRWPANIIHDGSDEVLAAFPQAPGQQGDLTGQSKGRKSKGIFGDMPAARDAVARIEDNKSAARFFYCAKASRKDRGVGNTHPTVKPTDLMRYLCRLVTPPGGVVLDPFMGSGSTGRAAHLEGFRFVGIEMSAEYLAIARTRIAAAQEEVLW